MLDLDGTLLDSKPGIIRGMVHTLESLGVSLPTESEMEHYIGPPLDYGFKQMLQTDDMEAVENAVTVYREYYRGGGIFDCALYDGVPELLRNLQGPARSVFLVTSKPQPFAEQLISHFELDGYVQQIYGATFDPSRARKTDVLKHALNSSSVDPETAVMVGDRDQALLAANANGTSAIGVLWGYGSRSELDGCRPDAIAEQMSELASLLLSP